MADSDEHDIYDEILDKNLALLQACQQELGKQSCMQCDKMEDCTTREKYVKAVYESMSHGSTGDFSF